jgi:hypothetical protein
VAYYVSLGSRGILLRLGTRLIAILGGLVYWRASRRRRLSPAPIPLTAAVILLPELDRAATDPGVPPI